MKRVMKYSGIAALSVSLIMLSLGSIPQSYAGSVGSTMTLALTCGVSATGTVDWGTNVAIGQTLDSRPGQTNDGASTAQVTNNGLGLSTVSANTGDDSLPSGGGGYSGTTDGLVHIQNPQIQVDIGGSIATMAAGGANIPVGTIAQGATEDLDMVVALTSVQQLPTTDTVWAATVVLTSTDCVVG